MPEGDAVRPVEDDSLDARTACPDDPQRLAGPPADHELRVQARPQDNRPARAPERSYGRLELRVAGDANRDSPCAGARRRARLQRDRERRGDDDGGDASARRQRHRTTLTAIAATDRPASELRRAARPLAGSARFGVPHDQADVPPRPGAAGAIRASAGDTSSAATERLYPIPLPCPSKQSLRDVDRAAAACSSSGASHRSPNHIHLHRGRPRGEVDVPLVEKPAAGDSRAARLPGR